MKEMFQKPLRRYFNSLYESMCNERYSVQTRLVEHSSSSILLDCGCREGDNTLRMAQQIGTDKIFGLDVIYNELHKASKRGIICIQCNLNEHIPLNDNTVDVILATDVIEHLINPSIFMKEIFRILKYDGYVIIDTPNLASWHNIFALLLGIQPFSGPNITTMEDSDMVLVKKMHRATHGLKEEGNYQEHSELELTRHIIVLAYVSLKKLVKSAGFRIEKEYGFGYYPFPSYIAHFFQRIDIRHTHHIVMKLLKTA